MTNKVFSRFSAISQGKNKDASDEYYTLYPAFSAMLLELLARHAAGKTYKVIICPCDGPSSIFHELVKYADLIGNPKIIYSHWPDKDWESYFDMDYKAEFGCSADDVLICTNPPFKKLGEKLITIKCQYLLFGSTAVCIRKGIFAKCVKVSLYLKNNETYTGDAEDRNPNLYGRVATAFYSNSEFLTHGKQYINPTNRKHQFLLFDNFGLKRIK